MIRKIELSKYLSWSFRNMKKKKKTQNKTKLDKGHSGLLMSGFGEREEDG